MRRWSSTSRSLVSFRFELFVLTAYVRSSECVSGESDCEGLRCVKGRDSSCGDGKRVRVLDMLSVCGGSECACGD